MTLLAIPALAPAPSRSPWQRLLSAVHLGRRRSWQGRQKRLPRPVVSVGNLHLGGSGKTPLVLALARHLIEQGYRVTILSRGYRRRSRGIQIVSLGDGPRVSPGVAGDEPFLLAQALPQASVVVGSDRHAAGLEALAVLTRPTDLFLLDDGFTHVELARDLDLLAFPVADPFGGGRLLPSGRLREPLAAARWADAVVLTGLDDVAPAANEAGETPGDRLARSLRPAGFEGPGFYSLLRTELRWHGEGGPLEAGAPVLLVTGVAREAPVRDRAERTGLEIVEHLVFPDHHAYPAASLDRIDAAVARRGAVAVLTTSKDRSKIEGRLGTRIVELWAEAEPEPELLALVDRTVARLVARPPRPPEAGDPGADPQPRRGL